MAGFNVGQIVQLDAWGFGQGALLQTGDRGTVVVRGHLNEFDAYAPNVLWHKNGITAIMSEDRLSVYTNPADAPGRSHGVLSTMQALRIVMREEQPHAMEEGLRDVERARMMAEDFLCAAFSPTHPVCTPNAFSTAHPGPILAAPTSHLPGCH